jgi:MFS family permease
MLAHIAADAILMLSGHYPWAVFASLTFMGVHMGVMNGPLLGIAVSKAPAHLRGTAFGIFYTVMAVIAMSANSFFGSLWHTFGAPTAFGTSAALTVATLTALPWLLPSKEKKAIKQHVQTA